MKAAQLTQFGNPRDSVACIEIDDPGAPGAGEILMRIDAAPINPAEILLIKGAYAARPPLPAPLGIEGAGEVLAVGAGVTRFAPGDKVMSLPRTNWRERIVLKESEAIHLPAGMDIRQASMLKVNPATAFLMLRDYVDLSAGDWVIQNAANSGVGINLIKLAAARGLKTINLVRREDAVPDVEAHGGDVTLVDGPDLAERVAQATGGNAPRLAIDAVAGEATQRLAQAIADGGTVVNYGMLSGEPCRMAPDDLVFKSKSLTGFWLAKYLTSLAEEDLRALYADVAGEIMRGAVNVPIDAVYDLDRVADAVDHAAREKRGGKVLILPNGE